ncbi:hypothetical protein FOCC_FOCC012694 [Frankliniella occidentalis]|nr:hypothetical protein FOCC_FOCC012694 [Frankliniella occidentalis]
MSYTKFCFAALVSTPQQSTPKSARTKGSQKTPVLTPAPGQSRVIGVFPVTPRTPAHPLVRSHLVLRCSNHSPTNSIKRKGKSVCSLEQWEHSHYTCWNGKYISTSYEKSKINSLPEICIFPVHQNIPSGSGSGVQNKVVQKAGQAPPDVIDNEKMLEYVTNKQVHTLTLKPLKSFLKGKIDRITGLKKEALVAAVYNLDVFKN